MVTGSSDLILSGSLTNAGSISGVSSEVRLLGNWDNTHGTISVDSLSTLSLGFNTLSDPNPIPLFADASAYALNLNHVGTINVADGATIDFGGLITTDQFNAFPNLPGVNIHFPADTVQLDGWLDNSPADNPISHGVLALTAATGALQLNQGYIYRGKITTSGTDVLEHGGYLDGVELDGTVDVEGAELIVLNGLILNGTVDTGSFGELAIGDFDNASETISGSGTILLQLGGSVFDLSNTGLTIGSGITINAVGSFSDIVAEGSSIDNLGTIEDNTAGSTLSSYGFNRNTFAQYQPFANYSSGTLTGGTWVIANGATWQSYGLDLTTNAANLSVSGTGTQILDFNGNNALAGLTTDTAAGSFTVGAGFDFTAPGSFNNAGVVDVQSGAGFGTGSNTYSQSAGKTTVDGTLTAANVALNGGGFNGTGTIAGNLSNAATVTPGDAPGTLTIQGNYTQTAAGALDINLAGSATYSQLAVSGTAMLAGTLNVALVSGFTPTAGAWFTILTFASRSGNFSTETGLSLSNKKFFVPSFSSNSLTLVFGPGVSIVAGSNLYIIGGLTSNDLVQVKSIGSSNTGSTGVQVTATLNGVSTTTSFSQAFGAIYVYGFSGNDIISLAAGLTISTFISAGNGNDIVTGDNGANTITLGNGSDIVSAGNGANTITLGNGNDIVIAGNGANTMTLGNGNDIVTLGNGANTVTLGNGNDNTIVGNGNNVVVEGNGSDNIVAGNGDNLIVAGLGKHAVLAGNGSNILIDGSVQLTKSGDSLRQVLNDWAQYGALSTNVASIRSRLAVTYNHTNANTLDTGSGLDWFWETYAKDSTNRKAKDLLN